MSYQPYDRNPSGIVFFGSSPSDQVYESVSSLIYNRDTNTLLTNNLTASSVVSANSYLISDNGTIGTSGANNAITVAGDGSVSILGDLTVNGTTTTVNSTTLTVEDPIIILGSGSPTSDDNKDRGVSFNYFDNGSAATGFFGYDDSEGKFAFIPNATITNEVVTGASGTIIANLQGVADSASQLQTSRFIGVSGQVTGSGLFNGTDNNVVNVSLTADAINGQIEAINSNSTDYLIIASGTELRKITKSNFVSNLGAMSSFVVDDGTTSETVNDGETILFSDGNGAEFVITTDGNQPTITVNSVDGEIDHNSLNNFVANEHINHTGVVLTAGSGLLGGGDISVSRTFDIIGGDGITVGPDEIEVTVDDTTIELSATDGTGAIRVKDAGITEAKRNRTVDSNVISSKTADKDITLVDASSGNVTVSLPEITIGSPQTGRIMTIKRKDGSSNNVIIERTGSTNTIDGSTSWQLYYRYETLTVVSDGSNWYLI